MPQNYTPLNAMKFLQDEVSGVGTLQDEASPRPTIVTTVQPKKQSTTKSSSKTSAFDHFFFPFSIAILFLSLTVYGIKIVLDNKNNLSLSTTGQRIVQALSPTPAPNAGSNSIFISQIHSQLNQFSINKESLFISAKAQYPNFTSPQLVTTINKNLMEFVSIRQYLKSDTQLMSKLKIQNNAEIQSYTDLASDLGVLINAYEKKDVAGKPPLSQLVEEFTKNSQIK